LIRLFSLVADADESLDLSRKDFARKILIG
jgi:hypothetical protein